MNLATLIEETEARISEAVIPAMTTHRVADAESAVGMFNGELSPMRGKLPNVMGLTGMEMMVKAGLDWKSVVLPIAAQGRREYRTIPGFQAIVRSDNAQTLAVTTDKFKAHQNSEIMEGIASLANAGNATICYAGSTDGGRKVVALAKIAGEFSLPVKKDNEYFNSHSGGRNAKGGDDKTHLFVVISGGHEVGTPFKVRGMALRRWCANGAYFCNKAQSTVIINHRKPLGRDLEIVRSAYDSITEEFGTYANSAARLIEVDSDREQNLLFVAELLQPGIVNAIRAQVGNDVSDRDLFAHIGHSLHGKRILNQLVTESEHKRSMSSLLNAIAEQDGGNGDNLWNAYNGVTWHVDHKRGRTDDTGVDSALFGPGALLKERALNVAMQFA